MKEKRKFNRWYVDAEKSASITSPQCKDEGKILDVSAAGMKVELHEAIDVGAVVYGEFAVLKQKSPFFIKGKVKRVNKKAATYETAIEFKNVSTLEFNVDFFNKVSNILNQ